MTEYISKELAIKAITYSFARDNILALQSLPTLSSVYVLDFSTHSDDEDYSVVFTDYNEAHQKMCEEINEKESELKQKECVYWKSEEENSVDIYVLDNPNTLNNMAYYEWTIQDLPMHKED